MWEELRGQDWAGKMALWVKALTVQAWWPVFSPQNLQKGGRRAGSGVLCSPHTHSLSHTTIRQAGRKEGWTDGQDLESHLRETEAAQVWKGTV